MDTKDDSFVLDSVVCHLLESAFAAFAFVSSLVDCAIRHYSVVLLLVQFSPPNQGEDLRREMEEAIKALTLKQGSLEAEAAESKARMNALEQQLNDASSAKRSLEAHAATLAIDLKSASDEREATDKALEAAKTDVRKKATERKQKKGSKRMNESPATTPLFVRYVTPCFFMKECGVLPIVVPSSSIPCRFFLSFLLLQSLLKLLRSIFPMC